MTPQGTDRNFAEAVICYANYARFNGNQRLVNPNVKSRMCLWCKSGRGEVIINGKSFVCESGDYFFLPWDHRIEYLADKSHPFHLAGIHIVPYHSRRHPVEYAVPHARTHPLYKCPWRKDRAMPVTAGIMKIHISADSPLLLMSEAIVQTFRDPRPKDENQIRLLASVLLLELVNTFKRSEQSSFAPLQLRQLIAFIEANYTRPLTVTDLAMHSGLSKSGITGLFNKYCGKTPIQWVLKQRIDKAGELLATTSLPVNEIGRLSGIDDQFYFSKLFKKMTGHSPLGYRKQNHRF